MSQESRIKFVHSLYIVLTLLSGIIYVRFLYIKICSHLFSQVNNHLSSAEQTVNEINIPPNAIVIGSTGQGAKLYMGGALHERILTPKKVIYYL